MGQELLQQVATWNAEGRNDMSKFGEILWRFDGFSNKTFKIVTIQVRGMHLFIWFIACIETVGPCRFWVLAPIAQCRFGVLAPIAQCRFGVLAPIAQCRFGVLAPIAQCRFGVLAPIAQCRFGVLAPIAQCRFGVLAPIAQCRFGVLAPIAHVGLGCLHLLPNQLCIFRSLHIYSISNQFFLD